MSRGKCYALSFLATLVMAIPGRADLLTYALTNPSFELPVVGSPGSGIFSDTNGIPGWQVTGPGAIDASVWAPTVGLNDQFLSIPDGSQVVTTYYDGYLSQSAGTVKDTDYVISAYVGRPRGRLFQDSICYTLQLWAGNERFGDVSGYVDLLPDGNFLKITATAHPEADQVGRELRVVLGSIGGTPGLNHKGSFSTFDNVTLQFVGKVIKPVDDPPTTPEPSTLLLVALGMGSMAAWRRRQKTV